MFIKNRKIIFIIFIIAGLLILNYKKYTDMNDVVVPVWSSHDEKYYNISDKNIIDQIKEKFNPDRLLYGMTGVRPGVPLTYLKREIPLLSYYIPEEIREPKETIYTPDSKANVLKLKFSLDDQPTEPSDNNNGMKKLEDEKKVSEIPSAIDNTDNRKINSTIKRPTIVIYHSHTSETYIDDPRYQDNNGHVLPGNIGNVGKVGIEMAKVLSEKYNFKVIHTTKIHDDRYSRSYYNSRITVKQLLEENEKIDLIIDVHRDGIKADVSRNDISTVINNQRAAIVMLLVARGKYSYGDTNTDHISSNWKDNLKLANSLAGKMDQMYPGLLRRLEVRDTTTNRYNQDLSPNSILIEIGDYRNTTQEAVIAGRLVADSIAAMFQ